MKEQWNRLIYIVNKTFDIQLRDSYYDTIIGYYSLEDKYYHNLKHIQNLLKYLNDFELDFNDKLMLELSIWFHDIIYDPKSINNEFYSAIYFDDFIRNSGNFDAYHIINDIIYNIILSTKHDNSAKTRLEKIMCDIDLRELAEDWYIDNSYKIKKEYSHLSNEEWKRGRIDFINKFLNKDRIYLTDEYYNLYETKARLNLTKEKEYLISDEYFRKIKN